MTLVRQRIFRGFSLKLKNKCDLGKLGVSKLYKRKGDEGKRGWAVRYRYAAEFGLD
jgi:hypothetical protein